MPGDRYPPIPSLPERREHEFILLTVVVRVYAPTSWTDDQAVEAFTGEFQDSKWDFAVKDLPRIIRDELEGFERDLAMPEGLRFEVS